MKEYKLLSQDYDALSPKESIFQQQAFYKKLIETYEVQSCLDCACGTGWHLSMFDELGLTCSGSDLSVEMLNLAKQNLSNKEIQLRQGDYRALSNIWSKQFDMITCLSNAINHMLTENDLVKALTSIYQKLNSGGIVVIDNGISDSMLLAKPKWTPARIHSDQAFYFVFEYPSEDELIINILNVKKTPDSFTHSFESLRLNAITQSKLDRALKNAGFSSVNYYGDHSFTPYSLEGSKRLVAVAVK